MLSTKVLGILAILVVLCLAALLALQYSEVTFFSEPPSVWPTAA